MATTAAPADNDDARYSMDKSRDDWRRGRNTDWPVASLLVAVTTLSMSVGCGAGSAVADTGDGFRTVVAHVRGIT